jgi:hypothetical protein
MLCTVPFTNPNAPMQVPEKLWRIWIPQIMHSTDTTTFGIKDNLSNVVMMPLLFASASFNSLLLLLNPYSPTFSHADHIRFICCGLYNTRTSL